MIIEHLLTMWWGLFQAGYRSVKVVMPETWEEYLNRSKRVVNEYKVEVS